jgi:integrase
MPYKKEWSSKENDFVWKFRVKFEGKEKKATILFTGQKDLELKTIELGLINSIKTAEESKKTEHRSLKIKFKQYIDAYIRDSGKHADNNSIHDMRVAFGNLEIKTKVEDKTRIEHLDFEPVERAFDKFMLEQETRKIRKFKNTYTTRPGKGVWSKKKVKEISGVELVDLEGTKLSESTLQKYRRYFCCICTHGEKLKLSDPLPRIPREWSPSGSVSIGNSIERNRPIEDWERKEYFAAIERLPELHWMLPVANFCRTMPIRPSDLCALTVRSISETHGQLKYSPQKTSNHSKVKFAYPAILPHMKKFILSRVKDTTCSSLFFRTGFKSRGENTSKHYPIGYWTLDHAHKKICEEAKITNLQFYDWRHDAVNFLISAGFDDDTIMKCAGWASPAMIRRYDTNDRVRLAKVMKEVLESTGNKSILQEMGT